MRMWLVHLAVLCAAALLAASPVSAQPTASPAPAQRTAGTTETQRLLDATNPISLLQTAGQTIDGLSNAAAQAAPTPAPGSGTTVASRGGDGNAASGNRGFSSALSILLLLTVLTVAPSLLVMCTSFTRILIVLALLRQAMGTQSLPPSQVLVGLTLFMTLLVMGPTFERINREALVPLQENRIDQIQAWELAKQPLRDFMFAQIEHAGNEGDLYMMLNYRGVDTSDPSSLKRQDVDMLTLIPAFILSELKVSFLIGFRLYLPFLIIDMVVSSVLISMGMLMLPPVLISLPFKLLLFVLVDGWRLVAGHLLNSFIQAAPLVAPS